MFVGVVFVGSGLTPVALTAALAAEPVESVAGLSRAELEAEAGTKVGDPAQRSGSPLELAERVDLEHDVISEAPAVTLPEPVAFDARLDDVAAGEYARSAVPGSVVRVGAPAQGAPFVAPESVAVEVLSQELAKLVGGQGLAFEVVRQDGKSNATTVIAEIDYSGFAHLYGGDWAQRLWFAWYPDCTQLVLAEKGACGEPVWLPIVNDVGGQRFTVEIPIDRTVESFERQVVAPDTPGMNLGGDQSTGADQGEEVTVAEMEATGTLPASVPDEQLDGDVDTTGTYGDQVARGFGRSFPRGPGFVLQGGGAGGGIGAISGGQSGTSGSFTATGLAAAGKWSVGGATGNFSYSYPIPAAPVPAGPVPELSLGYSSGGVDGLTASENTQGGLWGLGWEMSGLGFIERRYRSCSTDGSGSAAYAGDMCWYGDVQGNATISVAGRSSELVATGTNNEWRLKDDPFWKVQRCYSGALCNGVASVENGDDGNIANNEYWLVTTPEGIQYWFGYGRVSTSTTATNSVFYEPVYGNDTDEPCAASCNQAWRWNLDRIVDANGNTTQIVYSRETNMYQRGSSNGFTGTATTYVRGGYPNYIEYGANGSGSARPGRVYFKTVFRCVPRITNLLASCGTGDANWPDTPLDLDCAASPCAEKSPSFYTKLRVYAIESWTVDSSNRWRPVDMVGLTHEFFASTGTGNKLYLRYVQRTGNPALNPPTGSLPVGYTAAPTTVPKVRFDYTQLVSRTGTWAFNMWRLAVVKDEMGSQTVVTYGQPNPCPSNPPEDGWDRNVWNCWNIWSSPDGGTAGWARHQKYLVMSIAQSDLVGGTPSVTTDYTYFFTLSGADELYLWHHDDDPITPGTNQGWGDWRGYPVVITEKGTTKTETRYYRGMHGDKNSDTTTKSVDVKDSEGVLTTDADWLNGMVRETRSLDSSNQRINGTMHAYASLAQTATMTTPLYSPRIARLIRETNTYGDIEGSIAKDTRTDFTYNTSTGMVETAWNRGDGSISSDNRCMITSYTTNPAKHLYLPRATQLVSSSAGSAVLACDTGEEGTTVETWSKTYYDGNASHADPPIEGNVTKVENWVSGSTWVATQTSYDSYGRPLTTTDANNNVTTTVYAPTSGSLTSSMTVTAPLGMVTTSTFDPHRMAPDVATDVNGRVTDYRYDGLGRTLGVKSPVSTTTESHQFVYTLSVDAEGLLNAPAKVESKQLYDSAGNRRSSFVLYDGFGRERETQSDHAPGATGRTVIGTKYNSRGLVSAMSSTV